MFFLLLILILGLLVSPEPAAAASSPVIRRITVAGNRVLSRMEILKTAGLYPGAPLDSTRLDRGMERLLDRYAELGYLWAEIMPPFIRMAADSTEADLALRVDEGPEARIEKIGMTGNRTWTAKALLDEFDSRPGGGFHADVLERDIDRLLMRYEAHGYPYCRVDIAHLRGTKGRLTIALKVDEGPFVRVTGFRVKGNTQTKPHVITRELRMKPGTPFDQRRLTRGRERLRRMGLFDRVAKPRLEMNKTGEGGIVVLGVQEARSSSIDGIIGYTPGVNGESGFVTGALMLSLRNIAGTARRVDAEWTRRDPLSSHVQLKYDEPWIFGKPVTAGMDLSHTTQDSSYTATRIGLHAEMPLSDKIRGRLRIAWRSVIPDSISTNQFARSREISGALGMTVDRRDRIRNPRRGFLYAVDLRAGLRLNKATSFFTPAKSRVRTSDVRVDLTHYAPLFRRHVVAVAVHGVDIRSGEKTVPLSDQFRFGGTRTLRGYRENEFHGSQVVWSNLEYRVLLSSRSRFFAFLDTGYFSFKQSFQGAVTRTGDTKIGYGLGIRLESSLGILGIDYGIGEDDPLLNGKLHIGLQNEF